MKTKNQHDFLNLKQYINKDPLKKPRERRLRDAGLKPAAGGKHENNNFTRGETPRVKKIT
ncbi:MAG: hypothetical protein LBR53_09850 [Deltaproteobacteria bacterium]|jgi:hypothetical protein|nr:hypothetical protein [Deltaproteobacteria bacterium]